VRSRTAVAAATALGKWENGKNKQRLQSCGRHWGSLFGSENKNRLPQKFPVVAAFRVIGIFGQRHHIWLRILNARVLGKKQVGPFDSWMMCKIK